MATWGSAISRVIPANKRGSPFEVEGKRVDVCTVDEGQEEGVSLCDIQRIVESDKTRAPGSLVGDLALGDSSPFQRFRKNATASQSHVRSCKGI